MFKFTGIMLGTDNPERLTEFYKKVLGEPTWRDSGYVGWELGNAGLMIGEHSEVKGRNESPGRILWNLETTDVKQEFDRIRDLGATVVKEPYMPGGNEGPEFWMATFEDPDGNYFQLASPMPDMPQK